ncbi:hypothetical protein ACFL3X_00820 [Gemmatimonadota bacterium]
MVALEAKDAGWTPEEAHAALLAFAYDQCDPPVGPSDLNVMLAMVDSVHCKATSLRCESGLLNGKSNHRLALGYSICHKSECGEECAYAEWEQRATSEEWKPIRWCFRQEWEGFLRDEYGPRGLVAIAVYHVLIRTAIRYGLRPGDNIFIGLRKIAAACGSFDKGLTHLRPMEVSRAITLLSMWGLVEVSSRGTSVKFGKANSYILRTIPSIRAAARSLEAVSVSGTTSYMGTSHIGNTSEAGEPGNWSR